MSKYSELSIDAKKVLKLFSEDSASLKYELLVEKAKNQTLVEALEEKDTEIDRLRSQLVVSEDGGTH